MDPRLALPNGVYRTPGREPAAERIPRPSPRTLLAPLAQAGAFVLVAVAPLLLFNSWIVPTFFLTAKAPAQTFVPTFDFVQDGVALLLAASLVLLIALIVRRVRPSWRGLGIQRKVAYVTALVFAQSAVVMGAEYALFESRGGLNLFEPHLERTFSAPDGRTAFLYREGLGCGYHVHVAEPHALTMKEALHVSRQLCNEPLPTVRWEADGSVLLLDPAGAPLVSQPETGWAFRWGHC